MTDAEMTELCELGTRLSIMVKKYNKYDHKIERYTCLLDVLEKDIEQTKKRMKELGWKDVFECEEVEGI